MKRKIIEYNVVLEPRFLNQNIRQNLLNTVIKNINKNKCHEQGYIINVNKLISINYNNISRSESTSIFNINIEVDILKPEIGMKVKGRISMIFVGGIFLDVNNIMKIMIPSDYIDGEYKNEFGNISFGKFKKNMLISCMITQVRYTKKEFSCIGKSPIII